jgi:autotransporter-associated beta strand protein
MRSIQMRAATAMVRVAGAAVALGSLANAAMGQTWVGPASDNWSTTANWQGGVPVSGATTALVFRSANGAAITANNDLGTPFLINSLAFNVNNAFTVKGAAAANLFQLMGPSPSISMTGVGSATMSATGGNIELMSDLTLNVAGPGNLAFSGVISDDGANRALTIAGSNPVRGWSFVNLGAANTFTGGLTLDGGVVTAAAVGGALGPTGSTLTVTSHGGAIAPAFVTSSLGTLQLNGDVHFIGAGSFALGSATAAGAVQGGSTLYVNTASSGSPVLRLHGNSGSFTGAVVIDQGALPNFGTGITGTLSLQGVAAQSTSPNGSLHGAASFDVRAGGTLELINNNVVDVLENGDRIGDTTPVRLRSGNFTLQGPAAAGAHNFVPTPLTEKIGVLSGAGNNTLTITQTAGVNVTTTLEASQFVRLERGTFNFHGVSIGDGVTANRGRIVVDTTGPGTFTDNLVGGGGTTPQNVSILPWAVGGPGALDLGTTLVTYGADGFRPLKSTIGSATFTPEYYQNLDASFVPQSTFPATTPFDTTSNVELFVATTVSADATMNALVLAANGATDGSVNGIGTLNITSGAVIAAGTHATSVAPTTISVNLAFGAAEAVISTPALGGLKIEGMLTGSNGLTKTSNGGATQNNVLTLTGDNSGLTGPLTINGGYVEFGQDTNLPGRNSGPTLDPIVVNGSNVSSTVAATGFFYAGGSPTTLNRPIAVNTGMFTILMRDVTVAQASWTNIGSLTLAGPITGAGGMNYQPQATSVSSPNITIPGDIYVTGTSNTYSGPSRFAGGITHVYGEGSLGTGPWEFNTGTMVLEGGNQTNSRYVNFSGPGTIDTNGNNLTLNGPITGLGVNLLTPVSAGNGGLTKKGAGTLTLNSPVNTLAGGPVAVNVGTLIVNGNIGGLAADTVTVAAGATLGGSGTIYRAVTVNGTLSPGNSPGTLSTQNLTLNGNLACDVAGISAADLVNVTGTVTLGAASELDLAITGTPSGPVIIVQNDGSDAVSGTFATVTGLPAGATINYAFTGTDSLGRVGDGNDIAVVFPVVQACYANCDGSTIAPILNVADFTCFLQKFAAADPYANCDHSTVPPVLNVADFTCFLQKFAAGCP